MFGFVQLDVNDMTGAVGDQAFRHQPEAHVHSVYQH